MFELWAGATNQTKQRDVNTLKTDLQIIDLFETIAEKSGLIFQELKQKHQNIGDNDITKQTIFVPVENLKKIIVHWFGG